MNAALLTDLGRALGLREEYPESRASRPLPAASRTSDRERRSQSERAARAAEPSLPDACYYAGPLSELGPAPAPHVRTALSWGYMDREASDLAQRSREDLIRFFQMKARLKLRGRKPR